MTNANAAAAPAAGRKILHVFAAASLSYVVGAASSSTTKEDRRLMKFDLRFSFMQPKCIVVQQRNKKKSLMNES